MHKRLFLVLMILVLGFQLNISRAFSEDVATQEEPADGTDVTDRTETGPIVTANCETITVYEPSGARRGTYETQATIDELKRSIEALLGKVQHEPSGAGSGTRETQASINALESSIEGLLRQIQKGQSDLETLGPSPPSAHSITFLDGESYGLKSPFDTATRTADRATHDLSGMTKASTKISPTGSQLTGFEPYGPVRRVNPDSALLDSASYDPDPIIYEIITSTGSQPTGFKPHGPLRRVNLGSALYDPGPIPYEEIYPEEGDPLIILEPDLSEEESKAVDINIIRYLEEDYGGDALLDALKDGPGILVTEPILLRQVQDIKPISPNDPLFVYTGKERRRSASHQKKKKSKFIDQWALRRVGFTSLTESDSAWSIEGGNKKNVVVAVIDSGLDLEHPDGPQYVWTNRKEKPGNGIDDDKNGFIDDVHGWNFISENGDLTDNKGHGTFVAGIIAAKRDNGIGIAGINPGAQIMALKVVEKGDATNLNIYRALRYATDNGAKIINISLGGRGVSKLEQIGINYAYSKGVLVIVSAGNQGKDISRYGPPAARRALTVSAMNGDETWAEFSNSGANIGLLAPGHAIFSLHSKDVPWTGDKVIGGREYRSKTGTSFSAPIVAGTASLILAKNPRLTNKKVEDILLETASEFSKEGWDNISGAGLLDAHAALSYKAGNTLTIRPVEVIINRDKKKVTSADLFGVVRGDLGSYIIEIGQGKEPKKWEHVTGPHTKPVEYKHLARIDAKHLSRVRNNVIRITAKDKKGNTKVARLDVSLKK